MPYKGEIVMTFECENGENEKISGIEELESASQETVSLKEIETTELINELFYRKCEHFNLDINGGEACVKLKISLNALEALNLLNYRQED